jgi:hypothetical protein
MQETPSRGRVWRAKSRRFHAPIRPWRLKCLFSLQHLMLRPTVDTLLPLDDVGAAEPTAALQSSVRSRAALQLEVLALRHQLHVLQRSRPPRLRLAKTDIGATRRAAVRECTSVEPGARWLRSRLRSGCAREARLRRRSEAPRLPVSACPACLMCAIAQRRPIDYGDSRSGATNELRRHIATSARSHTRATPFEEEGWFLRHCVGSRPANCPPSACVRVLSLHR